MPFFDDSKLEGPTSVEAKDNFLSMALSVGRTVGLYTFCVNRRLIDRFTVCDLNPQTVRFMDRFSPPIAVLLPGKFLGKKHYMKAEYRHVENITCRAHV